MEQMSSDSLSDLDLQLDIECRQQLTEAGKWAKFISVSVFILCGLFALLLFAARNAIIGVVERYAGESFSGVSDMAGGFILGIAIFILLLIAAVYYFMLRFAVKIKSALATENANELSTSLSSLKIFFAISAVLGVITLLSSLYTTFTNL